MEGLAERAPADSGAVPICNPEVFEGICQAVIEGYRAFGHGGLEVGGVLFGRFMPSGITVEASRPLESEHLYGPSLQLSPNDEEALGRLKKETGDDLTGLEPVGWYRSYTRRAAVKEGDFAVLNRHFPGPGSVLLLLKPAGGDRVVGTFFFRGQDGGPVASETGDEMVRRPLSERFPATPPVTRFTERNPPASLPKQPEPPAQSVSEPRETAKIPHADPSPTRRLPSAKLIFAWLAPICLFAIFVFAWQAWHTVPITAVAISPAGDGSHLVVTWSSTAKNAVRGELAMRDEAGRSSTILTGDSLRHGIAVVPRTGGTVRATIKIWDSSGAIFERDASFSGPGTAQAPDKPDNAERDGAEEGEHVQQLTERNRRLEQSLMLLKEELRKRTPAKRKAKR